MARDIPGQLKAGSIPQLVECSSQVNLDYLLGRADDFANFTVRKPLPDQVSDLDFFRSRSRGIIESLPGSWKLRLPASRVSAHP